MVRDTLQTWAVENGGGAEIVSDPFHLLAMLMTKPAGFRAYVLFVGEAKRGEYEETGAVDRNFGVIISRNRGLTVNPGDALVKGETPLFELVEGARNAVRSIQFEDTLAVPLNQLTTEVTPNYLGCEPFPAPDGKMVDAYQLNFAIGSQLPAAA